MQTLPLTTSERIVSKHSLVAVSHEVQKRDDQTLADFANDLEAALRDLESAFKTREKAGEDVATLKKTLDDQNWWDTLKSTFNGATDKNLAKMVQDLGASLGLTQSALRVILKVQTEKNRMLRAFNNALVEKIAKIQQDIHTLDRNQKAAALNFLQELQFQINEQIEQQEMVERHEVELQGLAQWRVGQSLAHVEVVDRIDQMQAVALGAQQRVAALEAEISKVSALRQQVVALELENQRLRAPMAVLWRNLLPLGASLIAGIALFMAIEG